MSANIQYDNIEGKYGEPKYDIEQGGQPSGVDSYVSAHHPNLKLAFLRRVYGILSCQLAVTVAFCALSMLHVGTRTFLLRNANGVMWGALIPTFACLIALMCYKNVHPVNIILLSLFTLFESATMGVVCAAYYASGAGDIILLAFGLTLGIFVGLTLYTMISKTDFSFMGAGLTCGLFLMIGWGFVNLIFGWNGGFVYALAGALLFMGFILFDTWRIMEKTGYDDHIMAAITLYLDFINLFLYILRLLDSSRR